MQCVLLLLCNGSRDVTIRDISLVLSCHHRLILQPRMQILHPIVRWDRLIRLADEAELCKDLPCQHASNNTMEDSGVANRLPQYNTMLIRNIRPTRLI